MSSIEPIKRSPIFRLRIALERHLQSLLATLGVFWRAPGNTLLTLGVITVSLLIPFTIALLVDATRDLAGRWEGGHQLSAFLRPDHGNEDARKLAVWVAHRAEVKRARVITKEQALEEFRLSMGMTGLVESLGEDNPLPAVVVVVPDSHDPATLRVLAQALEARPEVELVQLDELWLERLAAMLSVGERVLMLVAVVLGLGVILVIGHTLRLSIEARRAEIEVEKLFGASDAFVRRPFLYHGVLYGLGGSALACLVIYVSVALLAGPTERLAALYGGGLSLSPPSVAQSMVLLSVGALLGLTGSWLSVKRHLRQIEPR